MKHTNNQTVIRAAYTTPELTDIHIVEPGVMCASAIETGFSQINEDSSYEVF